MNKKVLTLCAGFLLAGSLSAVAQYSPAQSDFYRSRLVKAAALDVNLSPVNKINQEYYYQLEVDPATLGLKETDGTFVLTAERDYSTGKIYLTAQKITNATLTHSLWKIKVIDRSANGRVYTYENKETGYLLTFDHTNALQRVDGDYVIPTDADKADETDTYKKNAANYGWTYENKGLTDGCIDNWAWYTTEDNGTVELPSRPVYSYFHNGTDSVMALHAVRTADTFEDKVYDNNPGLPITKDDFSVKGLSENGLDGSSNGGWAIVAVKDSKANARATGPGPVTILPSPDGDERGAVMRGDRIRLNIRRF